MKEITADRPQERIRRSITHRVATIVIQGLHGYDENGNRQKLAMSAGVCLRVASDLHNLANLIEDEVGQETGNGCG